MSVALLTQVFDETRRLAIAGSMTASGAFRLKKLIPSLRQAGKKTPICNRLAEAATAVVESNRTAAAPALLELSTLINAVLYTQGETGRKGKLTPIEVIDFGIAETRASANIVRSLRGIHSRSITENRFDVIREAFRQDAFRDLRLVQAVVAAIDDPSRLVAEFVMEHILPIYGRGILPRLIAQFDPAGDLGAVRRLQMIAKLDPAAGRELALRSLRSLENGSRPVKIAAVRMLGDRPEDIPLLLDQLHSTNSVSVRSVAIHALARFTDPAATEPLIARLEQDEDLSSLSDAIRSTRNPVLVAAVIAQLKPLLQTLSITTFKTVKAADDFAMRILFRLKCLEQNPAPEVDALLRSLWDQYAQFETRKDSRAGERLLEKLAELITHGSPGNQKRIIADHRNLTGTRFQVAFQTACNALTPETLFDEFSPYITGPAALKEGKHTAKQQTAVQKRDDLVQYLVQMQSRRREADSRSDSNKTPREFPPLDSRWLDLAVELRHLQLVHALAAPGHEGLNSLLGELFETSLSKPVPQPFDTRELVNVMVQVRHPAAADSLLAAVQQTQQNRNTISPDTLYQYGSLIPKIPAAQAARVIEWFDHLPKPSANRPQYYVDLFNYVDLLRRKTDRHA